MTHFRKNFRRTVIKNKYLLTYIPQGGKDFCYKLLHPLLILRYKKVAQSFPSLPDGYERIYFYHVRKCGGTSLDHMFMSLGGENPSKVYSARQSSLTGNTVSGGLFFGGPKLGIEKGLFFYASSHKPAHTFSLPLKTFTITILRDPLDRLLSYYKMLRQSTGNIKAASGSKQEIKCIGESFSDFLNNVSKDNLMTQTYMFSSQYSPNEAFDKISKLSYVFFLENFDKGIDGLGNSLQLPLKNIHRRKARKTIKPYQKDIDRARQLLEPEYELIEQVKKYLCHKP